MPALASCWGKSVFHDGVLLETQLERRRPHSAVRTAPFIADGRILAGAETPFVGLGRRAGRLAGARF